MLWFLLSFIVSSSSLALFSFSITAIQTNMATVIASESLKARPIFHEEWHAGKKVRMRYHYEPHPVSWTTIVEEKMTASALSEGSVTYSVNPHMHYLEQMYARFHTPVSTVRPDCVDFVQIAMTPKAMHNLVETATLHLGSINLNMDHRVMDIKAQWDMKDGMYGPYMKSIGDVQELCNWTHKIESELLEMPQPWYFSVDSSQAIPLFQLRPLNPSFVYKYRTSLTQLIRMRVLKSKYDAYKDGGGVSTKSYKKPKSPASPSEQKGALYNEDDPQSDWVEIPLDLTLLTDEKDELRSIPEMWAIYGFTQDDEVKQWKDCRVNKYRSYDIPEMVHFQSDNNTKRGNNAVVAIKTPLPIRSIDFVAEHVGSVENRNHSNYTTKIDGSGVSPCEHYSLMVGDIKKADRVSCSRTRFMTAWLSSRSCPRELGYQRISFVGDTPSLEPTTTLSAKDGTSKLTVFINTKKVDDMSPDSEFMLHAYPTLMHRMELIYDEKAQKWNIKYDGTLMDDEKRS